MSRIAPKSRTAGQPRRVTANWVFEQRSGPGRNVERSAFRKSHCAAGTKMTSRLEMTDIRKHKDATSQWHESAVFPSQPLIARGSSSGVTRELSVLPNGGHADRVRCEPVSGNAGNGDKPPQYIINCSPPNVSTSIEDSANDCTNDGTDSGLGSANMLSGNQEIMEYMAQNLMHYMNPTSLLPQLMKHGLLTEEDAAYINSSQRSDEERKERVLCALVMQEADAMDRLVECLAADTVHSTHCYMARRLREALEKRRQHPELPLTSLQLGSPPQSSKEPSPPAAPIKPRGAAQRSSIAKLLATKRNNVANLISQIETKESLQTTKQDELQPRSPGHPCELREEQKEKNNDSVPKTNMGMQSNESRTSDNRLLQSSGITSPAISTCTFSYSTHPVNHASPQQYTTPFSPSHTHPESPPSHPHTYPSNSHPHPFSPPHTHSPLSPPHSYAYPSTTSHVQSHTYPSMHTTPHSHPSTSTHSHSPPFTSTPPLPHTPSSFSGGSEDDVASSGSPQSDNKRCRPVNEVVLRCTSISHGDPGSCACDMQVRDALQEATSDDQSWRKSLPDFLSSPTSPKSPKLPMLPPVNTSLPACVHPPERPTDDLPSPTTPDRTAEDSIDETDMIPVARRNRTTRIAGLTARFYKHRRSASMSSYDTRSFKRGGQLSDSLSGTKREMSPFHNRSHGKAEPAQVRASLREGTEKLVKRRIEWLQERVHFTDCPEHIQFISQTHYGEERELLYSGTLNKHGKPRFVVLFTDYLLVLKARRPSVPSKLGGVFNFQSSRIDWFSDLEYAAKKPLPLHLLTVQHQSSKQSSDNFCLHFNDRSKVKEIVLQAVSKEARDIWVEELSEAITLATSAHADTFVLIGNRATQKISGEPYKKLQLRIHSASSLGLAANCNSFSLFCVIELGKQRCRTPGVMGGYNPSWDYKCEFTDFSDDDSLLIEVFSENIFRPNDFLGCVNVMLTSLPEEQSGRRVYDGNMVLAGLEEAFAGELHLTVEQGWETKM